MRFKWGCVAYYSGYKVAKEMPKKTAKSNKAETSPELVFQGPVYCDPKNGVNFIQIHAKPGAKNNAITGIDEEGVHVQISAAPVDGEANTELIKFISSVLDVRKGSLSLDKGNRSRSKLIAVNVEGMSTDIILEKLKKEIITKK